jgi:hypothetical protein
VYQNHHTLLRGAVYGDLCYSCIATAMLVPLICYTLCCCVLKHHDLLESNYEDGNASSNAPLSPHTQLLLTATVSLPTSSNKSQDGLRAYAFGLPSERCGPPWPRSTGAICGKAGACLRWSKICLLVFGDSSELFPRLYVRYFLSRMNRVEMPR